MTDFKNFYDKILTDNTKNIIKERVIDKKERQLFIMTLYDIVKERYDNFEENIDSINNTIIYTLNNV
tara:strand:- start:112 stop:312 length:201 start_codon:yes stop_codon:yes gene_type:complete